MRLGKACAISRGEIDVPMSQAKTCAFSQRGIDVP